MERSQLRLSPEELKLVSEARAGMDEMGFQHDDISNKALLDELKRSEEEYEACSPEKSSGLPVIDRDLLHETAVFVGLVRDEEPIHVTEVYKLENGTFVLIKK